MTQTTKTIEPKSFLTTHRPFDDMNGLVKQLSRLVTVMSWGAHGWRKMNSHVLRFMVRGHHHSGHVYIIPNQSDLFDIYLTTSRGTIKHKFEDIFIDELVPTIDEAVERIPAYKR